MSKQMKSCLILIVSIVIWGSSVVATRTAGLFVGPILLAFARCLTAAAVMTVIRLFRKDKEIPKGRDLFLIVLSAGIGISLYYLIENIGIAMTSASAASMISGSYPAITLFIGAVFFHERITPLRILGILVSFAGIAVISFNAADGSSSLLGILLLAADGVNWALYNYIVQAISSEYSDFTISYFQTIAASILFLPFLFFEHTPVSALSLQAVLCILYLGIFCSTIAYILYNKGLRGVSAFTAASLLNLMPVSGTLLSALILKEAITPKSLAGGVIIIAGVVISTYRRR